MSFTASITRRERDRDEDELHLSHTVSSSPFRLRGVSPISSKYRDAEGNEIPIYRTSCPDCHNHVKELLRIHELWMITKKDLRESRRAHENLLKEYKEEVDKTARQHQRIVDGFHDEIEALRADLRVKAEQVQTLRQESAATQHTYNEVNGQLSLTHDRYAEQVAENSALQIRVRELEQALTHVRLEKESAFDQTVAALREDARMAALALDRQQGDLHSRDREVQRLQEVIDAQAAELTRWKQVERKQTELFEASADERARLHATVRQQSAALDERAAEVNNLRARLEDTIAHLDAAEDSKRQLGAQVRELQSLEEQVETQALGEFRRSRRHIEQRLDKLQTECAQVAHMMSPSGKNGSGGGGGGGGLGGASGGGGGFAHERLPDWLPPAVATLVHSFRTSLREGGGRNIGEEMSSFLIALNRIWRERLEEKLRQVRLHHAADIRELKRRLAQRIPYEQVVQKARILRLQKDLDTTRAVHLRSKGDTGNKGLLDLSLSTVENLSRQILEYERENSLLKSQTAVLLAEKQGSSARSGDSAAFLASATLTAVNSLGDKLWGSANALTDRALRIVQQSSANNNTGGPNEVPARIQKEGEAFLDSLEIDVRACKTAIKRALAEAEANAAGVDDYGAAAAADDA